MGIDGLLPLLKNVTRNVSVSALSGKRVAVDGYCWLHKGTYACSQELCTGVATDKFLGHCVSMLEMLLSYNITPVIVFDGGPLPSKLGQEQIRKARREEGMKRGLDALREGDREKALLHFRQAVDVTPRMALVFIEYLRQRNVEYVVAPFEADAQLAFLCREGIVDAVITEDSDMIPYGVSCIVYKMDKKTNTGDMICLSDVMASSELRGFTPDMIRQTCILSGCDYLESPKNFGLKKALALMKKTRDGFKVARNLRFDGKYVIPPDYEALFKRAELTFRHQQVYDPRVRKVVPLTPLPDTLSWDDLEPFLGPQVPEALGRSIAEGVVDPITRLPFNGGGSSCGILAAPAAYSPRHTAMSPAPSPRYRAGSGRSSPFVTPSSLLKRNALNSLSVVSASPSKSILSFFKPVPKRSLDFEEEEKARREASKETGLDEDGNDDRCEETDGDKAEVAVKQPYVLRASQKASRPFVPPSQKTPKLSSSDGIVVQTRSMLIKSRFFNSKQ